MKKQLYDIIPKFNEIYRREQEFWFDEAFLTSVMYYGRFVGFWGLSFIILLSAFWRSNRAVGKVRSRLFKKAKVPNGLSDIIPVQATEPDPFSQDKTIK